MTLPKRMVLQRRVNYRIKCRKDKLIRCLPVSLSFRLLQTTYSQMIGVCKYFCAVQIWHMLFWLLKDAWLTCSRCSFSVLPTPFWSPIRHLLQTTWQPIDWLLVTNLLFCLCLLYLQKICLKLCNNFSKPYLHFQHIKFKSFLYWRMMME